MQDCLGPVYLCTCMTPVNRATDLINCIMASFPDFSVFECVFDRNVNKSITMKKECYHIITLQIV